MDATFKSIIVDTDKLQVLRKDIHSPSEFGKTREK